MQNIIKIKNATFYGYHGVRSEEQSVGGKFEVDVSSISKPMTVIEIPAIIMGTKFIERGFK